MEFSDKEHVLSGIHTANQEQRRTTAAEPTNFADNSD